MESMRAVGYTLQTAIADIIDNSISANAVNVDIYFNSSTPDYLAIIDDGDGMTADEVKWCGSRAAAQRLRAEKRTSGGSDSA